MSGLLRHLFEQWQKVAHRGDLLLMEKNQRLFEHALHPVGVRDEVGRQVASVELHALDQVEFGLQGLRLLYGDDAVLADLIHRLCDERADLSVVVGRDGGDVCEVVLALDVLRHLLQRLDRAHDAELQAALKLHRVRARRDVLDALAEYGLRENGRRGRAIARDVVGLRGDLLDHLRAHVLVPVFKIDLLRHRHAVLRDDGRAVLLAEHDVPALRPQRHAHRVRQRVHALEHRAPRLFPELQILRCHLLSPQ